MVLEFLLLLLHQGHALVDVSLILPETLARSRAPSSCKPDAEQVGLDQRPNSKTNAKGFYLYKKSHCYLLNVEMLNASTFNQYEGCDAMKEGDGFSRRNEYVVEL
ncbi:hypothetical protein B0H13DRAFT_1917966 [Mycena leptocephala]|nr:hypothetical protein B0H13DRAFT_1917966 [Mycena leptocephala]